MAWISRVILLTLVFLGGCEVFEDSKNKNSSLESLSVSSGVLNPAFSPDVTSYAVTVDAATDSITVTATAQKGKALVAINGGSGNKGSGSADVPVSVGSNSISVVVSAQKRQRQTTYTIDVTRLTPTYTIGGTVSGLMGNLTLQNNGGDDLAISSDGNFTFATAIDDGSTYDVTVASQPAGQQCTVSNGSGTLAGADVTNISVDCVDLTFSVGGQLSGLGAGNSITLQNNGGDDLDLTADGAFAFATELNDGANYDVSISAQPAGQNCTVVNGSGTVSGADVTTIVVDCGVIPAKFVAGIVTGLAGTTAVVQLNGGSDLLLARNGQFNFSDQFTGGEAYDVTVLTQPVNQNCVVTNGSGNIGNGHVLDVLVECTGAGVATGSIFDWEWVDPLPQGNPIRDFASDGTTIVAVGTFGLVQTSTDGLNWTTRDPGTGTLPEAIAYGNGVFVAVGADGTILTSSDGASWSVNYTGFRNFYGITWNGSQFVAVGFGWHSSSVAGAMAATSTDGINWSYHPVVLAGNFGLLWDVAWNGSLFVAVAGFTNEIATSPDGINWTSTMLGTMTTQLRVIESDGGRFVVIGSGAEVFTSDDGVTWTQEANPLPTNSADDLHWDGSRFVAVSGDQFITSADGSDWVANTVGTAGNATSASSVATHGGLNIIGTNRGAVYTSANDTGWTTTFTQNNEQIFGVSWAGGQFVGVGTRQTIRTSPDGITWTTQNIGVGASLFAVTHGGGQYVAVGFGAQVLTSPDAITWTPQALPAALSDTLFESVAWGNNLFVAVGIDIVAGQAKIATSPDGATWTEQSSGLDGTEFLTDVAWNGSVWVVTGIWADTDGISRAYIWTSPDGVSWTRQLVGLPDWVILQNIEWNGSIFVAVHDQGLATSADGSNWSNLQANAVSHDVTWTGSEFVIAGFLGDILSSADGVSWSATRAITGALGVASDGTTTVVVGGGNWGMVTKRPPP